MRGRGSCASPSRLLPACAPWEQKRSVHDGGGNDPLDTHSGLATMQAKNYFRRADPAKQILTKNPYHASQKLWPSVENMESAMTTAKYSAADRTPRAEMPHDVDPDPRKQIRGVAKLLQLSGMKKADFIQLAKEKYLEEQRKERAATSGAEDGNNQFLEPSGKKESGIQQPELQLQQQQQPQRSMQRLLLDDMFQNSSGAAEGGQDGSSSHQTALMSVEDAMHPKAPLVMREDTDARMHRMKSVCAWSSTGLDPLLAQRAKEVLPDCQGATLAQSRMIPALLHHSHKDLLASADPNTGKTTALVLAMLQGIRNESTGFNVLLASNAVQATKMYNMVKALAGTEVGGQIVDRPREDMSWVQLLEFREDAFKVADQLLESTEQALTAPRRLLITTADCFCELFFMRLIEKGFERFGYLRRIWMDDVQKQLFALHDGQLRREDVAHREDNPSAAEMALGSIHQLPDPAIRSLIQLATVGSNIPRRMKDHLAQLCFKPGRQLGNNVIATTTRIPSSIQLLCSFYAPLADSVNNSRSSNRVSHNRVGGGSTTSPGRTTGGDGFDRYLLQFLRNLHYSIVGRAIIVVPKDVDVLEVRLSYRRLGMDAKVLSEVYSSKSDEFLAPPSVAEAEGPGKKRDWKFLILREHDALHLPVPFVSHVIFTYAPKDRYSVLHMARRAGVHGQIGWMCVVCPKTQAKQTHEVMSEVDIEIKHHTVTEQLKNVDPETVWSWVKPPALTVTDPQFLVDQRYKNHMDNPNKDMNRPQKEFIDNRYEMKKPDYTNPQDVYWRTYNSKILQWDIMRDWSKAKVLQDQGLLDQNLAPTHELKEKLTQPHAMELDEDLLLKRGGKEMVRDWNKRKLMFRRGSS